MINDQVTQHETQEEISNNFEHILELIPGHIYWKDLKGRLLGCNYRQAKTLDFASPKVMIGKSTYDLLSSNQPEAQRRQQAEAIDAVDQQVMRAGKQMIVEEPQHLDDGNLRIFISQKVPLYDKHNNIIGLLGTSIDMTKQRQQELAKQEAELANETKNEFLRNMRHDIRTPFSGILGMTEIMAKEETNERKKQDLRIIAEAAEILLNYLNEILDYSHIESGVIPVLLKPFDLKQVMTQNLQALAPAATAKGLSLHCEYDKNLPEILIGDSFRIRRMLINLLSNAVKFTDNGKIELGATYVKDIESRKILVKIRVKDTGIGIPTEKSDVIFEKFTRLRPSYTSQQAGSGLGLRMVKQLTDELDADIHVNSELGEGTEFVIIMPFKLPWENT